MSNFNILLESGSNLLLESGFVLELERAVTSHEYDIETLVIQILEASATFAGVNVEHWVEDESTVGKGNRLTVQAGKRTPFLAGKNPTNAKMWQSAVTISAQGHIADAVWDEWSYAIDSAIITDAYPAAVLTAAAASFPDYLDFDAPDGGDQQGANENKRTMTRTFRAVFMT